MHTSRGQVGTGCACCCCVLWLQGVSKWSACWTVGCLYAVQLLHGVVRIGTAVLCVVWSGLVRLSFVWCGQDWYGCPLCGVVRIGTAVLCVVWSGLVQLCFVWCLYAVQLSHILVGTGIAVLCVVSVCCSVITHFGRDWYSCALCGVCLYAVQLSQILVGTGTAVLCVVSVCMLFSYHAVWSGLVWLYFVWCLYAAQLSQSVVSTGTSVLCVMSASVWVQC